MAHVRKELGFRAAGALCLLLCRLQVFDEDHDRPGDRAYETDGQGKDECDSGEQQDSGRFDDEIDRSHGALLLALGVRQAPCAHHLMGGNHAGKPFAKLCRTRPRCRRRLERLHHAAPFHDKLFYAVELRSRLPYERQLRLTAFGLQDRLDAALSLFRGIEELCHRGLHFLYPALTRFSEEALDCIPDRIHQGSHAGVEEHYGIDAVRVFELLFKAAVLRVEGERCVLAALNDQAGRPVHQGAAILARIGEGAGRLRVCAAGDQVGLEGKEAAFPQKPALPSSLLIPQRI